MVVCYFSSFWVIQSLLEWGGPKNGGAVSHKGEAFKHVIVMNLIMFIGAPFTSAFCESSICFLDLLSEPSPVVSSVTLPALSCTVTCDTFCFANTQCKTLCEEACKDSDSIVSFSVIRLVIFLSVLFCRDNKL